MSNRMIVALAVSGALAGCASGPVHTDYGSSVASLISAQTANPVTLTAPSDAMVTGTDPDYANNVVTEMRKDVAKPADVKKPIEMVLMGSGGGW